MTDDTGANGSTTRTDLLKRGGLATLGVAGVAALAGCDVGGDDGNQEAAGPAETSAEDSVLDKWADAGRARLGVDLTFPPLQFRDPETNEPTGYMVEITEKMMEDLGATPEYVQTPFAQLFAGLAAGKYDMVGIAATILPSRALQGWFAGMPVFYESNVILVRDDSDARSLDDLENAQFTVLQGSSQEASSPLIFPDARFRPLATESDAATEVAVGRADAAIFSEFSAGSLLENNDNLRPLAVPPLFVDANTYFMPTGDTKLWQWVTNWLRYQSTHEFMSSLWEKWVVPPARRFSLTTSVVGINGVAVPVET
jgi:ABC-type amino acid transport substrate-binding protein